MRVNTLSAGPFLTDISKIVSAALYLASPMSSYVTGSMVRVDGGIA